MRCLGMAETPVLAAEFQTSRVFFYSVIFYCFSFSFFLFFLQDNIRRIRGGSWPLAVESGIQGLSRPFIRSPLFGRDEDGTGGRAP